MLPNGTITVITLNRYCLLRYINDLLRQAESNNLGHLRVCLRISMCHPHTATYRDVKAFQLSVFDNRDEPQILRENVNIVGWRNSHTYFKLTR
ncbi:hypothetical protein D3C77_484310 [compost metagenome]